MKLERPGNRFWPRVLNLVNVFLSIIVLILICCRIDGDLVWIGNIIVCSLMSISLTATVISYRDESLFSEAESKSREAVRSAEKKVSDLEIEKIHLESKAVELQHLKEKYNSLQDDVHDLERDNATLQRDNVNLTLYSAQRIAELNSRITEIKLKKGALR